MSTRASLVVVGACAIVATGGCGSDSDSTTTTTTPTLDPAKIEKLSDRLSEKVGVDPSGVSLDCPSDEPVEEHQFNCTLTAADGTTATVRVTISNVVVSGDEADYDVDIVVPKSQFK